MATAASAPLIAELDDAVTGGSPERRVQILKQVTDLFLSDAVPVVNQIRTAKNVPGAIDGARDRCIFLQG
jgi:hypothetical protein